MNAQPSTADYLHTVAQHRQRLLDSLGDAAGEQRRIVEESVRSNAETEFGRQHDFAGLKGIDDFRSAVPIMGYDEYAPWIERAAAGHSGVLTAEDPLFYFTSSGSTGDPKKIPITLTFARDCFMPFLYATYAGLADRHADLLDRDDAVFSLKHDPGSPTGLTPSGKAHIGASQLDFAKVGEQLQEPGTNVPWGPLPDDLLRGDTFERLYHRVRIAAEHDVRCVVGINPAQVAALPWLLRRWWVRLVDEIRTGTLGGGTYREPNPERAGELERMAEEHGALLPRHIWPHLELVVCWNTGLASLYLSEALKSFGDDIPVHPAPVAASEGPIGIPIDDHPTAGPLVVSSVFYEFLPASEEIQPDSSTMLFDELEEGSEYHVLLTHPGGFYRYAVGDVVRVVGFVEGVPRVEYAGRSTTTSGAGERLRESQVVRALKGMSEDIGCSLINATARLDESVQPPRYEFALEAGGEATTTDASTLAGRLDKALAECSEGYREARADRRLRSPLVYLTAPDSFFREWERRVREGNRPPQVKDRVFWRDLVGWERLIA
jgi:hypothetical protein